MCNVRLLPEQHPPTLKHSLLEKQGKQFSYGDIAVVRISTKHVYFLLYHELEVGLIEVTSKQMT